MLLRIGMLLVVTGLAFIGMTWLEPVGPLLIILGAGCAAITLEARLDLMEWKPAPVGETDGSEAGDQPRAA